MELTSFCLALFLWCTFPKCFMEQIWMMCNMSNPSILILFICSQLLSHLFALEKRNLLCYLTCTVFPKISTMIFLINQKRFQGNVPFYQVFEECSYSSNGWLAYLWLSKSLTQNPVYWLIIEPACQSKRQKRLVPSLVKGVAAHSRILAWRLPWTGSLAGYRPWVCEKSDTTEWLSRHTA